MKEVKKPRKSGIELLRIIAMLMIVAHHFAQHTVWPINYEADFMFNTMWIGWLIEFGKVGVAIFFMIFGYFLATQKKFDWKRIFKLLRPMWFYSAVFLMIALATRTEGAELSWPLTSEMARSLMPTLANGYWFIATYVVLTLISPFLKRALDALKNKELIVLVTILLIAANTPLITSLAAGTYEGAVFTPTTAVLYAIIGYAVQKNEKRIRGWGLRLAMLFFSLSFFAVEPIILYLIKQGDGVFPLDFFWNETALPTAMMATSLFLVFSNMKWTNKIINYLAGLMFGVYLVHDNVWMVKWLWKGEGPIHTVDYITYGPKWMILCSLAVILTVFFGSMVVEAVRRLYVYLAMFWYNKIKEKR